ncbi:alpha-mannosidase [Phytoactinopolyspora halotolerans]|uniref:Alpha-mannosidase n=1 Tax=Phytoactinopolyspora halotolerans TaxID=1981512 RepID=A0A6L9SCA3_9ACTN|nr:glycoside hydrolase family 38 C-terminal domain-containing protein [Phytoactinopolyspora halotolerans]NEE02639.1 alpha-mannosidase [Phytoactinopolyspora halotolerans]
MHNHPEITLERLDRVLRDRILPRVHTPLAAVSVHAWEVDGDGEPVPAGHVLGTAPIPGRPAPDWQPFQVGSHWAPAWRTTWFRIEGTLPAQAPDVVELVLDLGWEDHSVGGHCEGLAYRPDGTVIKGLHPRGGWLRLHGPGASPDIVRDDGSFTVYVEAAANPLVLGLPPFVVVDLGEKDAASFEPYRLKRAELCGFTAQTWELARDLEVAGGLARELDTDEPRYWRLVRAIGQALDTLDPADVDGTAANARHALAPVLAQPAHATAHRATAVGHAHIDSAWLWPVRETERKVARTVANVLHLMDGDPDLVYAMSSAQQYAWLEENHPDLFDRLRARVREGRFVPVGGMWVESDAVMPAGESIVRQFTHGQRYFRDRFGIEPDGVWLPDSFGYSGALPQLARRAGFRWFLTQKISWNDTNPFPHHSFYWEGIDGSRIFTHFPPVDTYAAEVTARELHHAVANFRDKAVSSHSLVPFGYGDGGGGPTREMVARVRRFTDLEGAARVDMRPPAEFFREAEAEIAAAGDPAVWHGELYLELHRGTLTSQIAMKQGNRRAEAMLRTAEYLATAATVLTGAPYPADELDDIWKTVLLHQFHDILPGSSISWVHREARETYQRVDARLRALIDTATKALSAADGTAEPPAPGRLVPTITRSSSSFTIRRRGEALSVAGQAETDEAVVLDNGVIRAVVDTRGHVTSLRDAASGREIVPPGERLGLFQLFRDEPVRWDAWDIDRHVLGLGTDVDDVDALSTGTDDDGTAHVTVERGVGASRIRLTYRLEPGARRLDMDCDIDWQHREHLLKVCLPVAVRTTDARFETQYGYVERAIHRNTPWDEARFESCTHRYVHLEEPGFGVGVVNDSTYGADVSRLPSSNSSSAGGTGAGAGTMVRLSLLRGPRFPDPDTDRGRHRLRWSVVCAPDQAETVAAAYHLNAPQLAALSEVPPLVALEMSDGVAVVDWVKLADDGSGDVIVRIYEALGGRATGDLRICDALGGEQHATVVETDLLERPLSDHDARGSRSSGDALAAANDDLPRALHGRTSVALGPFQVATLRIQHTSSGNTDTKE